MNEITSLSPYVFDHRSQNKNSVNAVSVIAPSLFFTDCSETSNDLSASNGILRPIQGNIDNVRKHWKVRKTECKAKPVGSPSGYSPSRLLVIVNWSVNWFACVVRRHLANRTRTQFYGPIESDKTNKNLLPRQHPLRNKKTNFRSFIYSRSSTNPANLVKAGPVDVDIIIVWQKSLKIWNKGRT